MTQIFIFGASGVYGVGAEEAGWADLIKKAVHKKIYSAGGVGEKIEVFNFGKSGGKIEFVREAFPELLKLYGRKNKTISIISLGGNNAKAEGEPTNFVCTVEEFSKQMSELMDMISSQSEAVIAVGSGYYDETKTSPKISPFNGKKSFMFNNRLKMFQKEWQKICEQKGVPFVSVDVSQDEWIKEYLYEDGVHANQKGHQYIFEKLFPILEKEL